MNEFDAEVVVVGAGPAGSAIGAYLAQAGHEVIILEKSGFPRDKICGDALTPRAVKEAGYLGMELPESDGWHRNKGLRLIGGGHRLELDWPEIDGTPNYGVTRPRMSMDEAFARHAQRSGARLFEQVRAMSPDIGDDGWIRGVHASGTDHRGRRVGPEAHFRAPIVIAADGVSSRLAVSMGLEKRDDRPMGIAARAYHTTPRHADDYIESWVEMRSTNAAGESETLPGYGWIFPLGDGTVNIGAGLLDSSPQFRSVDLRGMMNQWIADMGHEWGIDETTSLGPIKSAALPMAFNRTPHFHRGLLLVGDSGGMVNPFNGEGIDYALESARIAAEVISTYSRYPQSVMRRRLEEYPALLGDSLGGYFTLGRVFASIIGHPALMQFGIKYGMGVDVVMEFVVKLLANLYRDPKVSEADLIDRIISALTRIVPATSNV